MPPTHTQILDKLGIKEEIRARKPSLASLLTPDFIERPFTRTLDRIKEGLFGDEKQKTQARALRERGISVPFTTTLKQEGFLPFLGRSKTEQVELVTEKLRQKGIKEERASSLAFFNVFGRGFGIEPEVIESKLRFQQLNPTKEEKKTIKLANLGQMFGAGLDVVGIIPVATVSKAKIAAKPLKKTQQILADTANKDPQNIPLYRATRRGVDNLWGKLREEIQDELITVKRIVDDPTIKISDASNPYQAEILFHGRVGGRIDNLRDTVKALDKDIIDTSKKFNISDKQLTKDVNDFLISRHAPERNAQLGDGAAGITTKEANARFKEILKGESSEEVVRIADQIQTLNNKTLDTLLGGEVITQDLYDLLRKRYKNHIPLQRVLETEDDFAGAIARGFDVRGTGIKRAKGSEKQVRDVLGNITFNYEQALIRAEKNRVDLATLRMVRDNKKVLGDLIEETEVPIVPVAKEPIEKLVDPVLQGKLQNLANKLNVKVTDVPKLALGRKKLFGVAIGNDEKFAIKLRVASDENTFAHELGHVIDLQLQKFDFKTMRTLDEELSRIALRRASKESIASDPAFKKYILSFPEKAAEAFSMFVNNRNDMRKIAPRTVKFFTDVFEKDDILKEVLTFKPTRQRDIKLVEQTIFRPKPELLSNNPSVLVLREKGKPVFLKINDPQLAVALRGISRQKLSGMLRGVAAISRFYSGLHTRFNPEFAFSNKIRDIQEVLVYTGAQSELRGKGTIGTLTRELRAENMSAIIQWLRGEDTEGARLYKQMVADGGTTGGLGLSARKQIELDIDQIRKINRSKPRAAAEKLLRTVDDWNTIFEDSTRLSVYRQALEGGASRDRAARLAKEASVNFNKFGKQGSIINALYIFANASIQGTAKMLMAMKKPKVAATVSTAVMGSVYAINEWNDQVDPDWRNKITTWDRLNSFAVMIPSDDGVKYITIPVAWGIKPIKVTADQLYDSVSGKAEGIGAAMSAIVVSMLEAYNPAGGSDVVSAITPTILDIPIELARNQAWHGGRIRPDWDNNAPPSIQYFQSLRDTTTGRTAVGISQGLSGIGIEVSPADINYAYEQLIGGVGRTANKTVNTLSTISKAEVPEPRTIPVVSRFFKKRPEEEVGSGAKEFKQIEKILQEQSRERFNLNQQAEDSYQQLKNLPIDQAITIFDEVRANDPDLAKAIQKVKEDEDKGLTFIDRKILQLGVTNGERSKFLKQKFDELETKEQKIQLWDEYTTKGIISKNVENQLLELFK